MPWQSRTNSEIPPFTFLPLHGIFKGQLVDALIQLLTLACVTSSVSLIPLTLTSWGSGCMLISI